jgi:hypothetical protein
MVYIQPFGWSAQNLPDCIDNPLVRPVKSSTYFHSFTYNVIFPHFYRIISLLSSQFILLKGLCHKVSYNIGEPHGFLCDSDVSSLLQGRINFMRLRPRAIFLKLSMLNKSFGPGAESHCGSGSTRVMCLLLATAPQHCFDS